MTYVKLYQPKDPNLLIVWSCNDIPDNINYDIVYNGDLSIRYDKDTFGDGVLEKIFDIFNNNPPKSYDGKYMRSGDILFINNEYYLCLSIGWQKLNTQKIRKIAI